MKTKPSTTDSQQELKRVAECLYRSQSSNIYYAIIKRKGRQIKRSLRTTDSALAKRRLSDLLEQAEGMSPANEGKMIFSDLSIRWYNMAATSMKPSSATRQKGVIRSLCNFFGTQQTRKISRALTEDWAAHRIQQISARTYNYERQTLIRILDYAQREGILLDNPARDLQRCKERKAKPEIPTKEQFSLMISTVRALRNDAQAGADLCELLAYSGCRLQEGRSITWGDVDFKRKQFKVTGGETGTKNHEVRVVPLFPALEAFLKRQLKNMHIPPDRDQTIAQVLNAKRAMAHACEKADLPNFTHHHLRHFFCSNAIEAGVDFKAIAGWLGHKDGGLLVAKTYGHLRDEHSTEMAKRMTFGIEQ